MEPIDIAQRLLLLEKQVESAVSLYQEARLELISAIGQLRIEVETLRAFLQKLHPELEHLYPRLKDEVLQKLDPEWARGTTGKTEK